MLRAFACLAVCAELWLGAVALPAHAADPAPAAPALAPECPPFAAEPIPAPIPLGETGVAPSDPTPLPTGSFVPLPTRPVVRFDGQRGEALLALPKLANGSISAEFQLAPGARIANSYFSAVLCSTVVHIIGAADADPATLVQTAPAGSALVRNDLYVTASAEVRPIATGPDPYRGLEYALDVGQVDAARSMTNGAGARVAVLDSAPDPAHRDLQGGRIVTVEDGPGRSPATHGTLVAGIIHAIENNAFGIAGFAPGVDLLSVVVCAPAAGGGASDVCRLSDLLRGVDLAWENRAQIVNMALVGPPNPLLQRAMDRLDQLGVVLVAAVGNEGLEAPRYPAAYPSVIGVGAVDREGRVYPRGNRGDAVEVLAPGVEIVSTVPGDAFSFGDGTSLAAANVTGMLALAIAASGDPLAARTAFFQAAQQDSAALPIRMPRICSVLKRLGKPCPAP